MEFCCSLLRIAPVSARPGIKKQDRPNDIAKEGGVISENVLHDWSSDKKRFPHLGTPPPFPPSSSNANPHHTADNLCQQGGEVRLGSDHLPDGSHVRLE